MRSLALFIAVGWFWLLFYGVGPLNTASQYAVAGASLAGGSVVAALLGLLVATRRATIDRSGRGR